MASIILNDDITLTKTQIDRLPVFASMIEDIQDLKMHNEPINVIVSEDMSAPDILKYASCKEDVDYVLPTDPYACVARRTLDWCGVDVSDLMTPRELRMQLEQHKVALFEVAHLDCIEFVYSDKDMSFYVSNKFDFTNIDAKWNIKNMDELVARWLEDDATYLLMRNLFVDHRGLTHLTIFDKWHFTDFGIPDEMYKTICIIRDLYGCKRIVRI